MADQTRKSLHRHESLRPLSRHHHHALQLVVKINKLDDSPEAAAALKQELAEFWETGGQEHFREEEEILLPAYAQYAPVDRPEIVEMLLEHVQVRSLVRQLEEGTAEDETAAIRQLGALLEGHVRKEERVIFPLIEAALPEAELAKLAPYFHEHWEGK